MVHKSNFLLNYFTNYEMSRQYVKTCSKNDIIPSNTRFQIHAKINQSNKINGIIVTKRNQISIRKYLDNFVTIKF